MTKHNNAKDHVLSSVHIQPYIYLYHRELELTPAAASSPERCLSTKNYRELLGTDSGY